MSDTRTTAQRLKDLEDYAIRHGENIQGLLADINELQAAQRMQELKDVREEGTWTAVLKQLQSFDIRLSKIEGLGSKGLGVFVVALIGAFTMFIIRGGLA